MNASPRPVPGAITAIDPFGSDLPRLSVLRSDLARNGTHVAIASRSLRRCTFESFNTERSDFSSITQGRLVVFARPFTTGPATPNDAYFTETWWRPRNS